MLGTLNSCHNCSWFWTEKSRYFQSRKIMFLKHLIFTIILPFIAMAAFFKFEVKFVPASSWFILQTISNIRSYFNTTHKLSWNVANTVLIYVSISISINLFNLKVSNTQGIYVTNLSLLSLKWNWHDESFNFKKTHFIQCYNIPFWFNLVEI